jgi:hypothetical protein
MFPKSNSFHAMQKKVFLQFHFFVRGCHTKHPTILFAGFTAFDTQTYSYQLLQ